MTLPKNDPLLETVVQSYRLLELLGSGAVADVYKAQDINTGQFYAIKVMQTRWRPFPHVMPRFEAEAQLLFDLPHPHIVRAFPPLGYLNEEPTRPYFVMDYLEGGSLSDYLRGGGLLTFGQATEFIANICAALHFAHRRGVVHRDLKPANILLRERLVPESAVLTDFGIAKIIYQTQMTELANQPGTPEYMSPEQFKSQEATHFSDQYALGIILYWMMTHRLPFRISDPMPIGIQHLNTIPPHPSYINPDVTPDVDHVVMRAISKDPYHRFPDMTQLSLAFSQAVFSGSIENIPVNAMGGSRPTGQGTSTPMGTVRPTPTGHLYPTGSGLSSSHPNHPTPLGALPAPRPASSGSRSMLYAVLGVGGLISILLVGILGALLSLRPPVTATPTTVALAVATDEPTSPPTSTRRPTATPTLTPSKTETSTSTPRNTLTATRLSIGGSVVGAPRGTASRTPSSAETATDVPTIRATSTKKPTIAKTPTQKATGTSTKRPTSTKAPTRTSTATSTDTPTVTATPSSTATATPVPLTLDEMLTTFNSELGTTITFNCKRFVQTYDVLQNELVQTSSAFERARSLIDEADDYAVQIYQDYCRDNATDTAMKIDAMLYSRFRSETRQLMGD